MDSLRSKLNVQLADTTRARNMLLFAREFSKTNKDSGIFYFKKAISFAEMKILTLKDNHPEVKFYSLRKCGALQNIGILYYDKSEFKKAEPFLLQALNLRKKYEDKIGIASCYSVLGIVYFQLGNMDAAMNSFKRSLKLEEELGRKNAISDLMNNMALVYTTRGLIAKALECHEKSLKYREEMGDKIGISASLNNIASILHIQNRIDDALEYFKRSLKMSEEANDKMGIGTALGNIAIIYAEKKDLEKSIEYNRKSLKVREEIGDKQGIAASLLILANNFLSEGKKDEALKYNEACLKICLEIGDKQKITSIYINMADIFFKEKKIIEAQKFAEKAFKLSNETGITTDIKDAALMMKDIYSFQKKPAEGLKMFELYVRMRDSINNEETRNSTLKKQYEIEFNSKEREVKLLANAERKILLQKQEEDNKKNAIIVTSVIFVLILVSIFSIIILRSLRENKKTNEIVVKQKQLVEAKQKEVLDSIQYAKRLQDAILPADHYWKENLSDSFVLYKPKDIVAGDFYWMEKINGLVLFAVGDCTGHGVPGAMVSVVCSNALNRTVLEFKITDPGKILDKTRELVISTFEKSDKEVKDGMDISLCCFNPKSNLLLWAGANNALWYTKNNEIITVKANKQPIGKFELQQPFTTHSIQLNKGDMIFLTSDGYSDQFGGLKGKKFKYNQLANLLLSNLEKPLKEQKEILDKTFEDWKGINEQVDDVCIVGVKI